MHKDFVCRNCEDVPNSEGSAKEAHEVSPSKLNTEKVYTNLDQQLKNFNLKEFQHNLEQLGMDIVAQGVLLIKFYTTIRK